MPKRPSDAEIDAIKEERLFRLDYNCLSWWFPKLLRAGLPVPKTRIVTIPTQGIRSAFFRVLDGKDLGSDARDWLAVLKLAVEEIGLPCFLRTGHTSDKHNWRTTCYVANAIRFDLGSHVLRLIEFSECADIMGLPWNIWAVRELLPVRPIATLYRGMPLVREFRCFVEGDKLLCCHPYWPWNAVEEGFADHKAPDGLEAKYKAICETSEAERRDIAELATAAGKACGGQWSVDILDTDRGWMVTDMALANESWHWPGCKANPNEEGSYKGSDL